VTPLALHHMQQHPSRSVMHTMLCCIDQDALYTTT
jgi:hypothetical protein